MVDSATVSNADGSGVAFRKRDPQQFRALLARTITLHRRLIAEWAVTAQRYRAAIPTLTSVESWDRVFGETVVPRPRPVPPPRGDTGLRLHGGTGPRPDGGPGPASAGASDM
jgi:hypothetical protein